MSGDNQHNRVSTNRVEPALSVIVPTKNESGNIEPLLSRIERATAGIPAEVIFVDDSTDDTPQVIQSLQDRFSIQIALIARPLERRGNGLGGAVVEGFRIARAPWACVMDADLQHPPELISQLLKKAGESGADIVVGSRLAPGGDVSSLGARRSLVSYAFAALSHAAFPVRLGRITDPLSGLFLIRLAAVDLEVLHPDGFKILLEILARFPEAAVAEIPIRFGYRNAGQSKASNREVLRFLRLLFRLRFSSDQHFVQFAAVGASGLIVNSLLLAFTTEWLHIYYLVSLALATLGSTVWNFAFTELWVYRDRKQVHSRLRRFGMFFLLNNAALTLRGPIVFVLTSILGIHYLASNLLSLAALTVLRYMFADKWIWGSTGSLDSMSMPATYDIHGILSVVSDTVLLELEPFRTEARLGKPTIRVHLGKLPPKLEGQAATPASNVGRIRYSEGLGNLGFRIEIEGGNGNDIDVGYSPLLGWSPHVLYTNVVEPILRWSFVEKGYALVHGACLAFAEKAYLITAKTDTGKTATILKILARQRRSTDAGAFISDDLTLLSPTGKILTYPKPLTISHHTVKAINARFIFWPRRFALLFQSWIHSRGGRRAAHSLARTKLPMGTINAIVQLLIPPPKYSIQQLVPGTKLKTEAKLTEMIVIERSSKDGEIQLDPDVALAILLTNCEDAYGFPPYDAIKSFLYTANDRDLRTVEKEIIAQALLGIPSVLVRRKHLDWWLRIPLLVDENLGIHFRDSAEEEPRPPVGKAALQGTQD